MVLVAFQRIESIIERFARYPVCLGSDSNRWGLRPELSGAAVVSLKKAVLCELDLIGVAANPYHMLEIAEPRGNYLKLKLIRPLHSSP